MSVGHHVLGRRICGSPLLGTGRARRQLPVVPEEVVQVAVVPPGRLGGPGALEPTGERVGALAAAVCVAPAEALLLDGAGLGFRTDVPGIDSAMTLAERVAADDERYRLLVVHRHAPECLANVPGGGHRIRVAVGALRIDVDQSHLDGTEGSGEFPVAAVALISEPGVLGPPEDFLGFPDILSPETEPERLEAHGFHGAVAGEDQKVGPGDFLAVLLLDRPEQTARLVEACVVRPTVEGGEALSARAATAPAVVDPVRSRGVPTHPDEERPVVAVVGRPPVLRRRHHLEDVLLQRVEVEGRELSRVVEVPVHRIGARRVLVENLKVQLIGPPVPDCSGPSRRGGRGGDCWVFAFAAGHVRPSFCFVVSTRNADDCDVSVSVWSRTADGTATKHAEHPAQETCAKRLHFRSRVGFRYMSRVQSVVQACTVHEPAGAARGRCLRRAGKTFVKGVSDGRVGESTGFVLAAFPVEPAGPRSVPGHPCRTRRAVRESGARRPSRIALAPGPVR